MWPDGFYYQRQMFYNTKWTREMEKTFVDALIGHAKAGFFRPRRKNIHEVMCALYDVNKKHGSKVTFEWAQTRVARLRERYDIFRWVVNSEGVVFNQRLGFVAANDQVWKRICREELSQLFDPANYADNDVIDADKFDLNVPPPEEGWVDALPCQVKQSVGDSTPGNLSDSFDDSSSMWGWMQEFYGSESDADSVLPPPGVPRAIASKTTAIVGSPGSSMSVGGTSSTASNATPIKKGQEDA
ncbi:hypothetical protein Salat_1163800 [Sesamum alatum]|uniref:Myb/SANT-like domain-containing protein n=1 Tax=Sesamum alatum TaxID=300844 RepID=A0AAE1YEI3_9LAMI|nr:hypothetical protein Salat_1163800 [Sesamum alatum]